MRATGSWNPTVRVRELASTLVGWASETGTPGEAAFAGRLADLLRRLPYFRDHPDQVRLVDSHAATSSVVAVVRGTGSRTLALAGHYDVVAVENYRDLATLAFEPEALLAALTADLADRPLTAAEQRARDDLRSGDFLPGRGMLDMKSGLAAGIAVLEAFAANPDRQGNLILIATPDEERNSRGMRSLRDALPGIAAAFGLEVAAGINLDATSDLGDGADGRVIYRGTIGKALLFALVVGHSSHAGYPFEGVSASLIAAEIVRGIEGNPALCDRSDGEISPPPICLEVKDLRGGYEVTTPERVWIAFNWLSHGWSTPALLRRFTETVDAAMRAAIGAFDARARDYAALVAAPPAPVAAGEVIPVDALRERVSRIGGDAAWSRIAAVEAALRGGDDPLRVTRAIVDAMVTEARITGPAVVVGLGGLTYPSTHLARLPDHRPFADAIEAARLAFEDAGGSPIRYRAYFTGISDMSFFGHRPDPADAALTAIATPARALVDRAGADVLSFPVVNIGPWGREMHQRLERVHVPYSFGELPLLLDAIVTRFLATPSDAAQA